MKSWIRFAVPTLCLLAVAATLMAAATSFSIRVGPGVTEFAYEGVDLRIDTTADVIVYLSIENGDVVGRVETAVGTRSATVTITVLDDPERIIFQGRVVAPTYFAEYLPQETGRGEQ